MELRIFVRLTQRLPGALRAQRTGKGRPIRRTERPGRSSTRDRCSLPFACRSDTDRRLRNRLLAIVVDLVLPVPFDTGIVFLIVVDPLAQDQRVCAESAAEPDSGPGVNGFPWSSKESGIIYSEVVFQSVAFSRETFNDVEMLIVRIAVIVHPDARID